MQYTSFFNLFIGIALCAFSYLTYSVDTPSDSSSGIIPTGSFSLQTEQQLPINQRNNPNAGLLLMAQVAPEPQQALVVNQPAQPTEIQLEAQANSSSKESKKRRKEKKPEKPNKKQRLMAPATLVDPEEINNQEIHSLETASSSSSSSSSSRELVPSLLQLASQASNQNGSTRESQDITQPTHLVLSPTTERLNMGTTQLSAAGLVYLTERMQNLRELAFAFANTQVLQRLSNNSFGSRLEALTITGNLTEAGMRSIISACPSLRSLRISGSLTIGALRTLAHSPLAMQLRGLEINTQPLGSVLAEILTNPSFANLLALSIPNQAIGNAGVATLARAPFAPNLRVLNLRNNNLTQLAWFYLAYPNAYFNITTAFSQLQELILAGNLHQSRTPHAISGLLALTRAPIFRNSLRRFNIAGTGITITTDTIGLLSNLDLPNLQELSLGNQEFTTEMQRDEAFKSKFQSKFPHIRLFAEQDKTKRPG